MSDSVELGEIEDYCHYKINDTNDRAVQLSLNQQMRDLYILILRIVEEIRKQ